RARFADRGPSIALPPSRHTLASPPDPGQGLGSLTQLTLHPRVLVDPRHGLGSYLPGVTAVQQGAEVGGRLGPGGGDLPVEGLLVTGALHGGGDADRGREAGRAE